MVTHAEYMTWLGRGYIQSPSALQTVCWRNMFHIGSLQSCKTSRFICDSTLLVKFSCIHLKIHFFTFDSNVLLSLFHTV